jgi:hypothetical protein
MVKISKREQYIKKIQPYRASITESLKREKEILFLIKRNPLESASNRINLVEEMLILVSNYLVLNGISESVLKIKNKSALNEGRKSIYKAVIYLEDTVSNYIDVPFLEYSEKLDAIKNLNPKQRYFLIRKLGLAIQLLENAYGDQTKWRWSFVELEGRFAVVAKNLLDLKNVVGSMDPRSPNYESTMLHFRLVKRLLMQAADRYREKYELATYNIDDFKTGIIFLSSLRRILMVMGEREELESIRKKYDIWVTKLEKDIKTQKELRD